MRTQCTEVINPLRMQKKQIRHGLAPTGSTADARSLSHARREIFNSGKSLLGKILKMLNHLYLLQPFYFQALDPS